MLLRLVLVLFFLSSCGGGSGSSSDDVTIENNPINVQNSSQQCTDFDGSTYDRTFRCEFKHKGIDRYYYIQLGHPEAEGQSSILFNLHGIHRAWPVRMVSFL